MFKIKFLKMKLFLLVILLLLFSVFAVDSTEVEDLNVLNRDNSGLVVSGEIETPVEETVSEEVTSHEEREEQPILKTPEERLPQEETPEIIEVQLPEKIIIEEEPQKEIIEDSVVETHIEEFSLVEEPKVIKDSKEIPEESIEEKTTEKIFEEETTKGISNGKVGKRTAPKKTTISKITIPQVLDDSQQEFNYDGYVFKGGWNKFDKFGKLGGRADFVIEYYKNGNGKYISKENINVTGIEEYEEIKTDPKVTRIVLVKVSASRSCENPPELVLIKRLEYNKKTELELFIKYN